MKRYVIYSIISVLVILTSCNASTETNSEYRMDIPSVALLRILLMSLFQSNIFLFQIPEDKQTGNTGRIGWNTSETIMASTWRFRR